MDSRRCPSVLALVSTLLFIEPALVAGQESAKKQDQPFRPSTEEQVIVDLINKEREQEKLPTLKMSPRLFEVARAHSANMAKQDKMDHVLDGKNPADRAKETGYRYLVVGENIAWGKNAKPENIIRMWMESEHHQANILNKEFTETGLGIATSESGKVYYTQVFAAPRTGR